MLTLGSVRRWTECIAARVRERARAAARASERARHAIACIHYFQLGNNVDRLYSLFSFRHYGDGLNALFHYVAYVTFDRLYSLFSIRK